MIPTTAPARRSMLQFRRPAKSSIYRSRAFARRHIVYQLCGILVDRLCSASKIMHRKSAAYMNCLLRVNADRSTIFGVRDSVEALLSIEHVPGPQGSPRGASGEERGRRLKTPNCPVSGRGGARGGASGAMRSTGGRRLSSVRASSCPGAVGIAKARPGAGWKRRCSGTNASAAALAMRPRAS